MNGILCIDKPPGHTSFDVVARMRGIAKTRKIGHGGTLDPMATGVLPLFFGRATKACNLLPNQDKRYTAAFRLGTVTDTQDITGTELERHPVDAGRTEVEAALRRFTGKQKQVPPMYSAVQVDGKRLYDLARQGIEVERPAREITVYGIRLLDCDELAKEYTIDVSCSKGSYIRTLCHDIGRELGCGAVLTALRRTEACGFSIGQCIPIEEARRLADSGALESALLPVESAFGSLPRLDLGEAQARRFCNGVRLDLVGLSVPVGKVCAVYNAGGEFLGLAEPSQGKLKLVKLFRQP